MATRTRTRKPIPGQAAMSEVVQEPCAACNCEVTGQVRDLSRGLVTYDPPPVNCECICHHSSQQVYRKSVENVERGQQAQRSMVVDHIASELGLTR